MIAAGRYELLAPIGEGGMATLYLARLLEDAAPPQQFADVPPIDTASPPPGGLVAVKMVRDEYSSHRAFVTAFVDEAKLISRVSHDNIVRLYELGFHGTRIFLAMELLVGQTLLELAAACGSRGTPLPLPVLAWICARAAEGLHAAHESRDVDGSPLEVIHRDVTPSNIFITFDGRVKVIDFGLAKARGRVTKTSVGIVKGKLAYLAPEQAQLRGPKLDRRVDIFALGIILWELSLGRRLFKRETDLATLLAIQAAEVPDPITFDPEYPEVLRKVTLRALRKDRDDRQQSAADLALYLDTYASVYLGPEPEAKVSALMADALAEEHGRQLGWIAKAVST